MFPHLSCGLTCNTRREKMSSASMCYFAEEIDSCNKLPVGVMSSFTYRTASSSHTVAFFFYTLLAELRMCVTYWYGTGGEFPFFFSLQCCVGNDHFCGAMNPEEQTVTWLISLGVLSSPKKNIADPEEFLKTSLKDGVVLCKLTERLVPGFTPKVSCRFRVS